MIDLVESAVQLAIAIDRLRILNAAAGLGNPSPARRWELLDASEQVRLAIVALAGVPA